MSKKSFPTTGSIELLSNEAQWRMLTNGLVSEIRFSGIVERVPGEKVTIKLKIHHILPPEVHSPESCGEIYKNAKSPKECFLNARHHIMHNMAPRTWTFYGLIEGASPKPVIMIHIPDLGLSTYSFQREISENPEAFAYIFLSHDSDPNLN